MTKPAEGLPQQGYTPVPIYPSLTLAEKLQFITEMRHYSLEDGADAHYELHHVLIPAAIKALAESERLVAEARAKAMAEEVENIAKMALVHLQTGSDEEYGVGLYNGMKLAISFIDGSGDGTVTLQEFRKMREIYKQPPVDKSTRQSGKEKGGE